MSRNRGDDTIDNMITGAVVGGGIDLLTGDGDSIVDGMLGGAVGGALLGGVVGGVVGGIFGDDDFDIF